MAEERLVFYKFLGDRRRLGIPRKTNMDLGLERVRFSSMPTGNGAHVVVLGLNIHSREVIGVRELLQKFSSLIS